jgi:DNA-binding CsgD family transcriptional regulator
LAHAHDAQHAHLQRLDTLQSPEDAVSDTWAFERWHGVLWAGISVPVRQRQPDTADTTLIRQAALAIRKALFDGLAWQASVLQDHPRREVEEFGISLFSGGVYAMINREFPRVRTALAREGDPEHELLSKLPGHVFDTYRTSTHQDLETFRDTVITKVLADATAGNLEAHLSPESLRKAQQELSQWGPNVPPLEEWTVKQLSQKSDALAARCGLSLREAEVLTLRQQGLKQKAIGARLGIAREQVNTHLMRARKKMRRAAAH